MLRVRSVDTVDDFIGVPGDPADYAASVSSIWESGESGPAWCFVLEDDGFVVGRLGLRVTPTTTDPRWLGNLPPFELSGFGFHLPWESDPLPAGGHLLAGALAALRSELPGVLEIRVNRELHPDSEARVRFLAAAGFDLFQEREGFAWIEDGRPVDPGDRLVFRSIVDAGLDAYRAVMARCGEGTLDRNDDYYWNGCGADNWAAQMTAFLDPEDAPMWLIGYRGSSPVGFVAVGAEEDWGATIVHIGVVPAQRGNGYIHDLLAAGTRMVQRAGIATTLSDVDVLNHPMIAALRRAGHLDGRRPWHVWAYRAETAALVP